MPLEMETISIMPVEEGVSHRLPSKTWGNQLISPQFQCLNIMPIDENTVKEPGLKDGNQSTEIEREHTQDSGEQNLLTQRRKKRKNKRKNKKGRIEHEIVGSGLRQNTGDELEIKTTNKKTKRQEQRREIKDREEIRDCNSNENTTCTDDTFIDQEHFEMNLQSQSKNLKYDETFKKWTNYQNGFTRLLICFSIFSYVHTLTHESQGQKVTTDLISKELLFGSIAQIKCCAQFASFANKSLYGRWTKGETQRTVLHVSCSNKISDIKYESKCTADFACNILKIMNFDENDLDLYTCALHTIEASIDLKSTKNKQLVIRLPTNGDIQYKHSCDGAQMKHFIKIVQVYPVPNCYLGNKHNIVKIHSQLGERTEILRDISMTITTKTAPMDDLICFYGSRNISLPLEKDKNCLADDNTANVHIGVSVGCVSFLVVAAVIIYYLRREQSLFRRCSRTELNASVVSQDSDD